MESDSDMATYDDDQADLFDRCQELGLTAKQLGYILDCDERHARRIMDGSSGLSARHIRRFLRHADHRQADLLDDWINAGAPRQRIHIDFDAERSHGIDSELIECMRDLTSLMEHRMAHLADGVITDAEREIELGDVRKAIRALHCLHIDVAEQRTSKPAKRQSITDNAGGAA